ncbi:MAG: hypothetical protein GOVbin4685_20 [Prokaryotic dsDNA virus sp.]|jgi:hypothetical protein|nr:MAG: hypothetical protein GOVbin4685_20 [Prokaryotic dsDNA virus sp.]|tara:strand:- start:2271 stop:2693 length:423 start_codon:yes stop_codon:yes gene_type:complete
MIEQILKALTTPSNYERDWYAYATNQIAHTSIGVFFVALISYGAFMVDGEIPYKMHVFFVIAFIYASKEIFLDKWNGFDTVEDFLFVVVYGTGGTLYSFTEKQAGLSELVFDLERSAPFFVLFCVHLLAGVLYRLKEATK